MKDILLQLHGKYKNNYVRMLKKKHPDIVLYLNDKYPELSSLHLRIITEVTNEYPICIHNKERKFKGWFKTVSCLPNCACNREIAKQKFNITCEQRYGVKVAAKSSVVQGKIKKTNITKYGYEYPFQSKVIQATIKNTMMKTYGKSNAMHVFDFVDNFKQNIKITNKNKLLNRLASSNVKFNSNIYNNVHSFHDFVCSVCNLEFSKTLVNNPNNIPECPNCKTFLKTKFEDNLYYFLKNTLQVPHIITNSRTIISPLEIDIFLPKYNIGIEVNGSYWHSEFRKKDKLYHLNKSQIANEKGIRLIHIWQYLYDKNSNCYKSILTNILGKSSKLYARKCVIREISEFQSQEFVNENHLQGSAYAKINLGLYYENELVSVMSFSKPRYNKNYEWELIRFANKLNHTIIGGANKLFSYFVKNYSPNCIISYCDKSIFTGGLYVKLGFAYIADSKPNYLYTKNYKDFYSRIKFQKHKLPKLLKVFDSNLTEWENMQLNGYDRIWDCGNSIWGWYN